MDADTLENLYFGGAALAAAALAWNGWRQGVARQFMTLAAIAGAYTVGWLGRKAAAPMFAFLRYPEQITEILGGAAAGLVTFIAIRALGYWCFKRTAEQRPGARRTSFGVLGAVLGLAFAGVLFVLACDAIRLLGAIARSHVEMAEQQKRDLEAHPGGAALEPEPPPGAIVRGLADLSSALDSGSSSRVLEKVDPVPSHVYAIIIKLGIMVSRPDAVERFRTFPGVAKLTEHPKLHALLTDAEVARLLDTRSYLRLLRNEKVVALANDPDFSSQIRSMDLDAALSHALNPTSPPAATTR